MGYYLADGIYPEWATFVKTPLPYSEKHKLFAKFQESARKDVEWVLGGFASPIRYITRACTVLERRNTCRYHVRMYNTAQHDSLR
jgi:hypothetical protein